MHRVWLLLLLCVAAPAAPEANAGAFEEGLKVIRGLLERGQCAEGKKRLQKLLEEHTKAPYVLGRRIQVEELAQQLAFGAAVPPADPKTLISGELVQWNPKDGTIKLRYKGAATMKDWEKSDRFYFHPAPFRGPHTITIKGDRYPADTSGIVMVCYSKDRTFAVIPGLAATTTHGSIPATIETQVGEKHDTIGGGDDSPVDGGRAYALSISVNATQISCSYAGKTIARANKAADEWGSLGLGYFGECEIVLSGKIEPSWIQGLIDKERQGKLAEFNRRWQPKDDLPAWLFEAPPPAPQTEDPTRRAWPMALGEPAFTLVGRALDALHQGEASKALGIVDGAPDGSIPQPTLDYIRGMLLHALGKDEEAAACLKRVREKDPDFAPAAILETDALVNLGRLDEALAIYRDLLTRFPRAADLHAEAALFLGASGRWQEAERLVAGALANGARSQQLDSVSRIVHKAVNGPGWPKPHDCESTHYVVYSDMDDKVCAEASKVLEQAFAVFSTRLERAPTTKERFKVYLFSGEAGYQTHIGDLLGGTAPHTAGLYAPALRQLFIWNVPEHADMMKTVRHEGFHQYLDRIMKDPPAWFNEGLAEYFEDARIVDGKWTTGFVRRDHLETLEAGREQKFEPERLSEFLFLDHPKFMEKAVVNYPQSWAFIHFLLHTTRENRQLFDRFWDSFKKIPAQADAIRSALGDRSIEQLQRDLDAHIEGMRNG